MGRMSEYVPLKFLRQLLYDICAKGWALSCNKITPSINRPGHFLLIASRRFFNVSQYLSALIIVLLRRYSCYMTPFASQKTVLITSFANKTVLNFFGGGSLGSFQTIDFFLVLGVKWSTHVSSPVIILLNISSLSCLYRSKKSRVVAMRFILCSGNNWWGTHRAHTLWNPKFLVTVQEIDIRESGSPKSHSLSFSALVMLNNELRWVGHKLC